MEGDDALFQGRPNAIRWPRPFLRRRHKFWRARNRAATKRMYATYSEYVFPSNDFFFLKISLKFQIPGER